MLFSKFIHKKCNIPVNEIILELENENKRLKNDLACANETIKNMLDEKRKSIFY